MNDSNLPLDGRITIEPTAQQLDAVCLAIEDNFETLNPIGKHTRRNAAQRWWRAIANELEPPMQLIGWRGTSGGSSIYPTINEARHSHGTEIEPVYIAKPNARPPTLDPGIAHHGPPVLTVRDAKLCMAMIEWIQLVRGLKHIGYGKEWLPGFADITKSRLFWRLRSGKKALPEPPPTAFSCPWYEVIDEPERGHWSYEMHEYEGRCYVAQCPYTILERDAAGVPCVVGFGSNRFKLWSGKSPNGGDHSGWWIQVLPAQSSSGPNQ